MASTYTNLLVHIVFATKGRVPTIREEWGKDFHAYIGGIVRRLGTTPLAIGGVADHVHVLALLKATQNVADLVREVKKGSSDWANTKGSGFAWQVGYAALSVGRRERDAVVAYVHSQEEHHKQESSADELRRILEECGIECDPRYFE